MEAATLRVLGSVIILLKPVFFVICSSTLYTSPTNQPCGLHHLQETGLFEVGYKYNNEDLNPLIRVSLSLCSPSTHCYA